MGGRQGDFKMLLTYVLADSVLIKLTKKVEAVVINEFSKD